MLDLSPFKILLLCLIALIVFGPERLPALAAQAGRAIRELRKMAEGATSQLKENLGPEFEQFADLDIVDLHPKRFVQKHLMDELTGDGPLLGKLAGSANGSAANGAAANGSAANGGAANGSAANGSAANGAAASGSAANGATPAGTTRTAAITLAPDELPPYDAEAT